MNFQLASRALGAPLECDPTVEDCAMAGNMTNATNAVDGPGGPPLMAQLGKFSLLAVGAA